jgi:hypothetical protein
MVHTVSEFPDVRQYYRPRGGSYKPYKIQLLQSFIDDANLRFATVIKDWLKMPNEFVAAIRKLN